MASLSALDIYRALRDDGIAIFTNIDFRRRFGVGNDNTAYKILQRLTANGLLTRIQGGLYQVSDSPVHDFTLANTIITPSYVSLESALSRYGILSQFPFVITSVTPKKGKKVETTSKTFEYAHLAPHLFSGFIKEHDYLIATPEKALFDMVYLAAKGIRSLVSADLDLSGVDKVSFYTYCRQARVPQVVKYLNANTFI